jgi:hypothetical protein
MTHHSVKGWIWAARAGSRFWSMTYRETFLQFSPKAVMTNYEVTVDAGPI